MSTGAERVAVITDIHANLPALQAALARIAVLGIDTVFCGGDLVGYGPHPNEACALIAERGIPTIYGNYDYAIARDLDDCGCAYLSAEDRELGQRSVRWTLEHTDQRSKAWMRELPFDLHFHVGRRRPRQAVRPAGAGRCRARAWPGALSRRRNGVSRNADDDRLTSTRLEHQVCWRAQLVGITARRRRPEDLRVSASDRLVGAGALIMALCCAVSPLTGAAVGGGLLAGAGAVGAIVGVAIPVAVGVLVTRRRRGGSRC